MKRPRSARAFTLIELLVVIAIIGLLASIVMASLSNARQSGAVAAGELQDQNILNGLGDSLIGDWELDDCAGTTALDKTGFGNTGTLVGSPVWTSSFSSSGCALLLNGTSQYVNIPDAAVLDPTASITVTGWVKRASTNSNWQLLVSKEGQYQLMASVSGNPQNAQFALVIGGGWKRLTSNAALNNGQWYFLAGTYDGSAVKLYINGQLDSSMGMSGAISTTANPLQLGEGTICGTCYVNGAIDEIRVYTRTLTTDDVRKAYLAGAASHGIDIGAAASPALGAI